MTKPTTEGAHEIEGLTPISGGFSLSGKTGLSCWGGPGVSSGSVCAAVNVTSWAVDKEAESFHRNQQQSYQQDPCLVTHLYHIGLVSPDLPKQGSLVRNQQCQHHEPVVDTLQWQEINSFKPQPLINILAKSFRAVSYKVKAKLGFKNQSLAKTVALLYSSESSEFILSVVVASCSKALLLVWQIAIDGVCNLKERRIGK